MPLEIFDRIVGQLNNSGVQRLLTRREKPRNGANYRDTNKADAETGLVGWGGRIRTAIFPFYAVLSREG
jgi:hypothetical protein